MPGVLQAVLVKIVTEILCWQCAFGQAFDVIKIFSCMLLCLIDPRVRKINNEVSSCPGIFSRTLRFYFFASLSGSPLPHLLDGHRKLCRRVQGHAQGLFGMFQFQFQFFTLDQPFGMLPPINSRYATFSACGLKKLGTSYKLGKDRRGQKGEEGVTSRSQVRCGPFDPKNLID